MIYISHNILHQFLILYYINFRFYSYIEDNCFPKLTKNNCYKSENNNTRDFKYTPNIYRSIILT